MTTVMETVSKSEFKARALEYLRQVERSGEPLAITDRGRVVVKVTPYTERSVSPREKLRGAVLGFDDPCEPVGAGDWEALG
ncbi:MAG: type II toxin-antitoxin system Phd/YefM family antitoxin [Deltaproteobacteria bacterium]|nr:type II toxin-antitoxin system Phd/YefM family antitoxin [Deltaproteobacteria bacterium]